MYAEDDLLPISALQHLLFCERQCALIHLEQVWEENRLTVEGRNLHERVHERDAESRPGIRIVRALRLRSLRLGLAGVADVVEFHQQSGISGQKSTGQPFPVEYKRGRPKCDRSDEVQLCAQAMCLEEMLGCHIPSGALFYGTPRRRAETVFDVSLRELTMATAVRLHVLMDSGITPPPIYSPKCDNCSLLNLCMPRRTTAGVSVVRYLDRMLHEGAEQQSRSPSGEIGGL